MLSQSDYVSLRPSTSATLPNIWGKMMSESTATLQHRWEDHSVALADESALAARAQRMEDTARRSHRRRVPTVDEVDAWGYYHQPSEGSDCERKEIGRDRGKKATPRRNLDTSADVYYRDSVVAPPAVDDLFSRASPQPPSASRRQPHQHTALLTPPSIIERVMLPQGAAQFRAPVELPVDSSSRGAAAFTQQWAREIRPPPVL